MSTEYNTLLERAAAAFWGMSVERWRTAGPTYRAEQEERMARALAATGNGEALAALRLRVLVGPAEDRERALDAYVQARITHAAAIRAGAGQ